MKFTNDTDDFAVLPDGEYVGTVLSLGKRAKDDKVSVYFNVSINGETYKTRYMSMSDKAKGFITEAFRKIGDPIPKGWSGELEERSIRGLKVLFAQRDAKEYNGKTYKELVPVKPLGRATDEELLALEGAPF